MARERMVTRTVTQSTIEVMTVNVNTADVSIIPYKLGGMYDEAEALKKLKKLFETDDLKLVHVESIITEELLLGMPEEDFIRFATVLPPRKQTEDTESQSKLTTQHIL